MENTHEKSSPDYDFHIPRQFSFPLPVFIISFLIGSGLYLSLQQFPIWAMASAGICILAGSVYVGICVVLKRITNLERRLQARDSFINTIPWQGDEVVLDVGCGNGILTMAAAKQLSSGNVIGIDIWMEDTGDNHPEAFKNNASLEGVVDQVQLHNEDVRQLPYADETFDVVISGLTIHHLGFKTPIGVSEMIRVLKPGGWLAIYDEPSTIFYSAKLMRQAELKMEKKTMNMVFGRKI